MKEILLLIALFISVVVASPALTIIIMAVLFVVIPIDIIWVFTKKTEKIDS